MGTIVSLLFLSLLSDLVYTKLVTQMLSFREQKQMIILGIFAGLALIAMLVILSKKPGTGGEWICRGGAWIAEGKPIDPKPKTPCY